MKSVRATIRTVRRFPIKVRVAAQRKFRTRNTRSYLKAFDVSKDIASSRDAIRRLHIHFDREKPNWIVVRKIMTFLNRQSAYYDQRQMDIKNAYKAARSIEKIGLHSKGNSQKTEYKKLMELIGEFIDDVDQLNKMIEKGKIKK